jgi:hypothetical protein
MLKQALDLPFLRRLRLFKVYIEDQGKPSTALLGFGNNQQYCLPSCGASVLEGSYRRHFFEDLRLSSDSAITNNIACHPVAPPF